MSTTAPYRERVGDGGGRRLRHTWVSTGLVLAAVLYSAWLLEFPLHLGVDSVRAYASELAAVTRVGHRMFMGADLTAGLIAVAAAWWMLVTSRPMSTLNRVGWIALVIFGLGTGVDALLPLPCAPHADKGCAAREAANQLPISDALHLVSSSLTIGALLVTIVCFTVTTARQTAARVAGLAITGLSIMTTLWTVVEVVVDDTFREYEFVGLAQRFQLLALAAGMCFIASRAATDM
jgi:hypothetical protein